MVVCIFKQYLFTFNVTRINAFSIQDQLPVGKYYTVDVVVVNRDYIV